MKQGIYTSEFWIALAGQVLAILVVAGVISPADRESLGGAVTNTITAVATIAATFGVIRAYIRSRTALKDRALAGTTGAPAPDRPPPPVLPVVLAFLLLPAWAAAQCPPDCPCLPAVRTAAPRATCLFGSGRAQMELLKEISANQRLILSLLQHPQPPAPVSPPGAAPVPQVILLAPQLSPPAQQIPLGGPPLQQIPLGGPPKQEIPLGGPPRQDVPLGGPPKQDVPLGAPPRQQIDPGTPALPKQEIPIARPPMPSAPASMTYQRFRAR